MNIKKIERGGFAVTESLQGDIHHGGGKNVFGKEVCMRGLKKNQRPMHYALYDTDIPILDENNFEELETRAGYKTPVLFYASLSTGQSDAEESPFGKNVTYDRVISTCDTSLPIDENSLIWVKNTPVYNADGTVNPDSADYEVAAPPLDGLNSLRIAIKKRSKSVVEDSSDVGENVPDSDGSGAESGGEEEDGF